MAGILLYSLKKTGRGIAHGARILSESRVLAYYYDISKRLIRACGLPEKVKFDGTTVHSFVALGNHLYDLSVEEGLLLKKASFGRSERVLTVIRSAIEATFPEVLPVKLDQGKLEALRITLPEKKESLRTRLLRSQLDPSVSLKQRRAFKTLAERDLRTDISLEIEARQESEDMVRAIDQMYDLSGNVSVRQSNRDDLAAMLNIVTNFAWRIVGKSSKSETAGWIIIDAEGNIGTPLKYVVYKKRERLEDAKVLPLRMGTPKSNKYLTIPDSQTIEQINDERGSYISVREWENFGEEFGGQFREDVVILVDENGRREIYRRNEHESPEFYNLFAQAVLGDWAGKPAEWITGLASHKSAFFMLEKVDYDSADLKLNPGDIIRIIPRGTRITLLSAGSADVNIRDKKIGRGKKLEEEFVKRGMKIGLVTQDYQDIGNIARCLDLPVGLTVKDAKKYFRRLQNWPMIFIVGADSYTIWPIFYRNDNNEVVMVGAIQTTNPKKLEETSFDKQFRTHKRFGRLVSDGVTRRVQEQTLDKGLRDSLGPDKYRIVKSGQTELLRPRKIENVSTLFVDMSGFTRLSELVGDPDAITSLLSNFFNILDPNVSKFGGMVDKHIGDCQMAVWGVFEERPDNAEKALLTAVTHQRTIQAFNSSPEMQAFFRKFPAVPPLAVTVGISTGTVTAGNIGEEKGKIEHTVNSPSVNLAARLQGHAKKAQILIDETTFRRLSPEFLSNYVMEFNKYNRDPEEVKKLIRTLLKEQGIVLSEAKIQRILDHYQVDYKDLEVKDLYEEGVTMLKNIELPVKYFSWEWDRNFVRNKVLLKVLKDEGIKLDQ